MEVLIKLPKKDKAMCVALDALFLLLVVYDVYVGNVLVRGSAITAESLLFLPIVICITVYSFGMKTVYNATGVKQKVFCKTIKALNWSECRFIGIYTPTYTKFGDGRMFACATTPLRHKSVRYAKWNRWWGNPHGRIDPAWKRKEEISVAYYYVGDENYRKILELCGGERNVRETDLD